MNQFVVMQAWREWLKEVGLTEHQVNMFMKKGYDFCKFFEDALKGIGH